MRRHLRTLGVELCKSAAILIVMMALYVIGYLVFYQELPRWK